MALRRFLVVVALAALVAAEYVELDTPYGRIRGVKKADPDVTVRTAPFFQPRASTILV
jgi:hypothetical protein